MKTNKNLLVTGILFFSFIARAQVPHLINYQGRITAGGTNFEGSGQFKFALVSGETNASVQADATANVSSGQIANITVSNGGIGYAAAPLVTITDATGTGASAVAQVTGGSVAAITVTSPGSNYSISPVITIAAPSQSSPVDSYWSNDGTSNSGSEPAQSVPVSVSKGNYSVQLGNTAISNMMALSASVFLHSNTHLRIWFNDGSNGFQQLTPDPRLLAVGYAIIAETVPDQSITSTKLAPGAVLTNLQSSGQGLVPTGSVILSDQDQATNLLNAGYTQIGHSQITMEANEWFLGNGSDQPQSAELSWWTGTDLLIWNTSNGYRYNRSSNLWTTLSTNGAPVSSSAVWTGTELIVWEDGGGSTVNGARYNLTNDSWTPLPTNNAPSSGVVPAVIWTGNKMIVWRGSIGSIYDPSLDTWTTLPSNNDLAGQPQVALWTGTELIIWGGYAPGARLCLASNIWTSLPTNNAPLIRSIGQENVFWTGHEMIVWGGQDSNGLLNTGARYNPSSNIWTMLPTNGAPSIRLGSSVIWTGNELIVWGGMDDFTGYGINTPNTGARYNPSNNTWNAISLAGAPWGRLRHCTVWTGTEMIVWGGIYGVLGYGTTSLNSGGRYNPALDRWVSTSEVGAPQPNAGNSAFWTGSEMIIFGGINVNSTPIYKPQTGSQSVYYFYLKQ